MNLKYIFLLFLALTCFTLANAQVIKLKKGFVLVDGAKIFEYEKNGIESSLYSLGKENEIIFVLANNNGTNDTRDDDFCQIVFIESNRKLETTFLDGYLFKQIIEKLIKGKVLDLEGNIDSKKLDIFFSKYDQKISEKKEAKEEQAKPVKTIFVPIEK